ncbi:bifunctional diaminohydroxyphosphoribosylaminopyrimidine deaminase/5-amino-6-(5-phosphoribosylamino)uracil reductase RibD [Salinicoccus carnicancri]|uniref:bifunctional diaminohydroxyphosphoribosylaminopyrimidine deaminase/5-amino-6-(5-phosphoribosylamino)uracil reductase RibD n=1 Tax=Salinicoccus carnicancri TaxID=558170 RepID=UPI0002EBDCBF|nr:bifunctional diaminohydroxyphosphoribosylaminopyrimidine deaminase/5-amino-6-(5-phosphoribosylamino)uracil reductase RibD [Salinicoccus carnicancri]
MNRYMKMALDLAGMTQGQTGKNPPVGAVVVKDGSIIGMGAHFGYGQPHAERQALASCSVDPAGADIYVTLEPCSHHGKTPPCTDAIIGAGIRNVFYAERDLNPKVSGHEVLARAGLHVEHTPSDGARALYREFFNHLERGRPNITLKCAVSADGRLALGDGTSRWITGEAARTDVHYERNVHDAILVGAHTLLRDDPLLTTRLEGGGRSPRPVVLLGSGALREDLGIFHHPRRPVIYTTNEENLKYGDRCDVKIGDWSLEGVLRDLYEMKLTSLFVEGGASVLTSFIKEGLYDQIFLYVAPKIFGESKHSLFKEGIPSMDRAVQLELVDVEKLGPDLKITYRKA